MDKNKTREDEIERKVEAHTKVSMMAYDKGIAEGIKQEREKWRKAVLESYSDGIKHALANVLEVINKFKDKMFPETFEELKQKIEEINEN